MTGHMDLKKEITLATGKTLRVGQFLLDRDGGWYRVSDIGEDGTVHMQHRWGGRSQWDSYGTLSQREFLNRDFIILDSYEQAEAREREVYSSMEAHLAEDEEAPASDDTSLMNVRALDAYTNMLAALEEKKEIVETARRMMKRKADQVRSLVSGLETKISRLKKVLGVFELYLGVSEEIIIVRDGQRAAEREPIAFRQMVLYMDEEVADTRERGDHVGIDFRDVDDFDAWLVADRKHLDQVIPEQRGLVLIRPSRQKRHYRNDPLFNMHADNQNAMTYVLIRNGEAIFRIWTGEVLGPRLFPKIEYDVQQEQEWWEREEARDNDVRFSYRRTAMLLQGLLDRTEVFHPLPGRINLMNPDTYGEMVRFIRDEEDVLPSGRKSFLEWQKEINKRIGPGSRVVFAMNELAWYRGGEHKDHFLFYAHSYPPAPDTGIYQVSLTEDEYGGEWSRHGGEKRRLLRIMYNPGDEVQFTQGWQWEPHTRKNRVSFVIEPEARYVLNYDQIELEDVEFYLSSRVDRSGYLEMMPLLYELRQALMAEREKETHFVKLVSGRTGWSEAAVWEAVRLWKFKNQWKRRIDSDDAKALRMIEKHLGRKE